MDIRSPTVRVAAVCAAAAALLSGCGGSSAPKSSAGASGARPAGSAAIAAAPVARATATAIPHSDRIVKSTDPVTRTKHSAATSTHAAKSETRPTAIQGQNPCTLVTRAEAQAILGQAIGKPVAAPQGPTCIYTPRRGKRFVTLTVQSQPFTAIKAHAQNVTKLEITGRAAYCLKFGDLMTLVPLSGGRTLSVTASCAVGARFAAKALPRVTS
jgi:Protein of unknown function (DUF3558)